MVSRHSVGIGQVGEQVGLVLIDRIRFDFSGIGIAAPAIQHLFAEVELRAYWAKDQVANRLLVIDRLLQHGGGVKGSKSSTRPHKGWHEVGIGGVIGGRIGLGFLTFSVVGSAFTPDNLDDQQGAAIVRFFQIQHKNIIALQLNKIGFVRGDGGEKAGCDLHVTLSGV